MVEKNTNFREILHVDSFGDMEKPIKFWSGIGEPTQWE